MSQRNEVLKPKIYISGPMRGIPDFNFPEFNLAEKRLQQEGYDVINPADNPVGLTELEYMRKDLADLETCQFIYMLRGWEHSRGALDEFTHARYLHITPLFQFPSINVVDIMATLGI